MKPVIRKMDFTLAYLTEYLAILIVGFPLLNIDGLFMTHVLPTMLMAVILCAVHLWIGRIHPRVFLPVCVLSVLVGWMLGLPLYLAVSIGVVLLWRTLDVFKGLTFERLWYLLAISTVFSLAYSYGIPPFLERLHHHGLIMPLFILQLLSVFTTQLVYMGFRRKENRASLTRSYFLLSGSLIFILFLIGQLIMNVIGKFSFSMAPKHYKIPKDGKDLWMRRPPKEATGAVSHFHMPHWVIFTICFIGGLLIIALLIQIIKWKWGRGIEFLKTDEGDALKGHVETLTRRVEKESNKKRPKSPKDPVRLELYHLERHLRKSPHARLNHDTLHTWLDRLPIGLNDREVIASIYEKVRYGYKKITTSEWEKYRSSMQSIKMSLKE